MGVDIRTLLSCFLLMGCTYFRAHCNGVFSKDQLTQEPGQSTSAAQITATGATKRPVTVADSIQMTRLAYPSYTEGGPSKGIVAKFSPDGKHFVVILKKGNLEANTNEYSLVLFQTAAVFQSPEPRVLISLASSSNRPAIDNVLWLDDSNTILFLGERPGEQTQLYSLKCNSRELTRLTSSATNLTSFVTTASGEEIVYASKDSGSMVLPEGVERKGFAVTSESVPDLIQGRYRGGESEDESLYVARSGKKADTKIKTQGRIGGIFPPRMSLSPDGAHLLIQTEATEVPNTWSDYKDKFMKVLTRRPAPQGAHTSIHQYELVDTHTGADEILIDAPIMPNLGSEVAWAPDSKSVVVSDVYLPLNVDDPSEQELRKAHAYLVEVKIPSRQFVKVSQDDLKLLNWDPKTDLLACSVGRIDSLKGKPTSTVYFRKNGEAWSKASAPDQTGAQSLPEIILDEDMDTPPRIVAIDPTGQKTVLMDLNPQFQNLALARVEEITWKDSRRREVKGGLYWPPDYVAGRQYPVVIQTHGWITNRFWMDGPFTTAFAAQALASKGFFVVQDNGPDWHLWVTSEEAPSAMASYEGVVDYLDRRGLIDRNRVGITGFSRTYWYVAYALTHSKYHFAAAAVADGVDFSYFQYMAFSQFGREFEPVYGGPPYGKNMSRWLKQSPAFLMDKIGTPLRVQTIGPESLLSEWHWYSGLSRLGKPVEMIYIPGGTHILEKPWDRMISQQGNVDWFCFWLKGEEDSDPTKAGQYQRWRELRGLPGQKIFRKNIR
jgi:hypothetical protein